MANTNPEIGNAVTLHKHGLEFKAKVTGIGDDGTLEVMAVSKFGHDFPQSRVEPKPIHEPGDPNQPYWSWPTA